MEFTMESRPAMTSNPRQLYCRELAEMVAACEEDDPSPELVAQIEDHVRVCPVCQDAEAALNETVQVFRTADPGGVSEAFESALVSRLCRSGPDVAEEPPSDL